MKLMIIDGNSIINRAFYGVRPLSTKDGTPTNAVYGFLNILLKLMNEDSPEALCVAFDLKGPTFRHLQYDQYKAQRKPMPEDLAVQIPILKEVLDCMRIPRYELEGYEADDIIGSASKICGESGWECVVVTGDKDDFQLITDKTSIKFVKSRMGQTETKLYDEQAFIDEYGFTPEKMVDLKALMGDASDNIPGVAGVGEKTAMDLVSRFGSVENIYANIEGLDIKESVRKKLCAGKEAAEMSFDLATIRCDIPLKFEPEKNRRGEIDNDKLFDLFKKLEFTRLMDRFNLTPTGKTAVAADKETISIESINVEDEAGLEKALENLKKADITGFYSDDTDSFAFAAGNTAYVFVREIYNGNWKELCKRIFSAEIKKAGHNIKALKRRLIEDGYCSDGFVADTALCAYLLDPVASSYELERLAEEFAGISLIQDDENGQITMMSDARDYSDLGKKAAAVLKIRNILEPKLVENGLMRVYSEIELPLCSVLADMECQGFFIDKNELEAFGNTLSQGIDRLTNSIYQLAGEEFNINSPKQLGSILFDKMMLPAPKKTKTGYSTNIDVLEKLRNKHPIIEQIIDFRQLSKLKSTYTDGLYKFADRNGKIHTTFQMTVTATGRLSSVEPNLQNIPVRNELGGEIRKMFTAGAGNVLVDADYSQIELRLLADISGDETMRQSFTSGIDIHTTTASQVFGVPIENVTKEQRRNAKAVNFGIVYGISAFSLAQDIGVSVAEAKQYMDNYLEKFHGVREYMKNVVIQAKKDGFVQTLYGRRRYLPELKATNFNVRSFGERVALNMPIQGTAADIMKIAMINVHTRLGREMPEAKLILQIHDELIVECPEKIAKDVSQLLCEEMKNAAHLSVPLTAEAGFGKSWYEAK